MQRTVVKVYGILIAFLALVGLFVDAHWIRLLNVDPALDGLRVLLALFLLYVGFVADKAGLVPALWTVGGLYLGMGVLGMIDPPLWGLLPSGLTAFDIGFHLVAGLLALAVAAKKDSDHGPVNA